MVIILLLVCLVGIVIDSVTALVFVAGIGIELLGMCNVAVES